MSHDTQRIIYASTDPDTGEETLTVVAPVADSVTIEEVAQRTVPPGVPYEIVNVSDLPASREYRNAWRRGTPGGPKVRIDETKRNAIASERVRRERDTLLSASDWTQASDVPSQQRAAWAQYRQALRDVPQQAGFPFEIAWPTPPG
jgi:hypothetical protein